MEDERREAQARARARARVEEAIADVLEGKPDRLRECRTAWDWRQVLRAWLKRDGAGRLSGEVLAAVCELGDRAWNAMRAKERDDRTRAAVEAALAELSRARQNGQAEELAAAARDAPFAPTGQPTELARGLARIGDELAQLNATMGVIESILAGMAER